MNYKKYAEVLIEAEQEKSAEDFDVFFKNFLAILKQKNQTKTLPSILLEVKKLDIQLKKDNKSILIVRDKSFADTYKEQILEFSDTFDIDDVEVVEDEKIIGGYVLKNKKQQIDNSYKKRLLDLYSKIIK
jgi:F0F1-type ATP synthase delta subunit